MVVVAGPDEQPSVEAEAVRGWQFQRGAPDWRVLGTSGVGAWFAGSSHASGAALVDRIVELLANDSLTDPVYPNIDLRAAGVQVFLPERSGWTAADLALAQGISVAARELGLTPDPSVPQDQEWGIDTLDKDTLLPFWQTLLGYENTEFDDLLDPLRRDPRVWFHPTAPRPLRNRIHFDVAVAAEFAAARVAAAHASGPRGDYAPDQGIVLLADAEGNEVDFVPGDRFDASPETSDWRVPFGGMVFYPTRVLRQSADLARRVARAADDVGFGLLIDLRPDGVMIDTGKDQQDDDQWPGEEPGRSRRFTEVARGVQLIAVDLGLTSDPSRLRFFQAGIDAVDIPTIRAFWRAVLDYQEDPRPFVTDIYDPRRLNPPMFFQQLDPSDTERREQRNRIHLDLIVPHDQVAARAQAALDAGGRFTRPGGSTIADPEGNEVDIFTSLADPPPPA